MQQPNYKKFDRELYKQYDQIAKEIAKKLFSEMHGVQLIEPDNRYSVDLVGPNGEKVEVEVKTQWKSLDYPFSDIRIAQRKHKVLAPGTVFIVVNGPGTALVVIPAECLTDIVMVKNRYSEGEPEPFYSILPTDPRVTFWLHDVAV